MHTTKNFMLRPAILLAKGEMVKKSAFVVFLLLFGLAILPCPKSQGAGSLAAPSVTLPAGWGLSDQKSYPNFSSGAHDPQGCGLIYYNASTTYVLFKNSTLEVSGTDQVLIFYENSLGISYSDAQLQSEVATMASGPYQYYQYAQTPFGSSAVTTYAGVSAGYAIAYNTTYSYYLLHVIMVKGDYYLDILSAYANSTGQAQVNSIINSISLPTPPTPTLTPTPSSTPSPTPTPTTTPTPTPTATATPTPSPTPAPTETPTPAPTTIDTPSPTISTAPTFTPVTPAPTSAPTTLPTPNPTHSASPTPTTAPTANPTPTPATPTPTSQPTSTSPISPSPSASPYLTLTPASSEASSPQPSQEDSNITSTAWVPPSQNAVAATVVSAAAVGAVSLAFAAAGASVAVASEAATSVSAGSVSGRVSQKIYDLMPDSLKKWLESFVSSKQKLSVTEKNGSPFLPTKSEAIAYLISTLFLAFSFSYVKANTLSQILIVLPTILVTSIIVGFAKTFVSIVLSRRLGVWTEHKIWYFGLATFIITTFAFRMPFSSPTRDIHYGPKFTKRLGAILSIVTILISLAFAGFFGVLMLAGFALIGGTGLVMCIIGAFFDTFPIEPMSGKEIFNHNKTLWISLFTVTLALYAAWLFIM
jgi:hypothetical protein